MSQTTEIKPAPAATSRLALAANKVLSAILCANLASASAAALINIYVAAYVKQATGVALWAAAAIVVAYLPPLFIGSYLGGLIDRHLRRRGIMLAELGAASLTVGCTLAVAGEAPLTLLLALLAARSLLVAAVRNSLTRWLKLDAPAALQESRMQLFILAILLALPASGLAMGWAAALALPAAAGIGAIALLFHLGALGAMALLPAWPAQPAKPAAAATPARDEAGLFATVSAICADPTLAALFFTRIFAQPVFQAAEQILVSVKGAAMGPSGMAHMQTVGGCGLLLGFILIRVVRPESFGRKRALLLMLFGLACMLVAAHPDGGVLALPAFFGMTVSYEVIYVYAVSRFFRHSPADAVARYSITSTHIGGTLMSVSAMLFGLAIDGYGFDGGALLFLGGALVYGLVLLGLLARRRVR